MEMLYPWRQLSLKVRAARINTEKGLSVGATTLGNWYAKNDCSFLKARYRISDKYTRETKLRLQEEFSLKLLFFLREGYEIIYMDECSVTPWPKAGVNYWIKRSDPFYLRIAPGGFYNVSIFGAISNKQREMPWIVTSQGQNKETMRDFLEHILDWPLDSRKAVIVMDNAKWHHNPANKELIEESGLSLMYLPPGGSEFNPM